jgi:very-short-patch-repair endonuclease
LRFWNNDVINNHEGVMKLIMENLSPSPSPSHGRRGKVTSKGNRV